MASRPTKAFTSPDRSFGANGHAINQVNQPYVPGETPTYAPVPPDADYLSHVAVDMAVVRPSDAPAAARPSEPESSGLFRTPPTDAFLRANGYDPSRRK